MKQIKTILLAQLAVIAILLCISAPAWANLAANTQILNQATLSYWDGTQTKTAPARVTVTVTLVCAAPTLTAGAPQTTSYNGPATTLHRQFYITAGPMVQTPITSPRRCPGSHQHHRRHAACAVTATVHSVRQ